MDLLEAQDFIQETKQPIMYFDFQGERYRFQNLEINNGQTIYKYLSPSQEISFTVAKHEKQKENSGETF